MSSHGAGTNIDESQYKDIISVFGDNAAYKPTGLIEVYIANDDDMHEKVVGEFVNGIDVVGGMPSTPGLLISGQQSNGGENAQRYDGRIDLDFFSDDFGKHDTKFGFQNTRFPHVLFNNEVTGNGTYRGAGNPNEVKKFNAILSHPNYVQAVNLELMQLKKWANYNNISQEEVLKKLKANNPVVAERYEIILDKVDTSEVISDDVDLINNRSVSGITTDSTIGDVLINDESVKKGEGIGDELNTIGNQLNQYEPLLSTFDTFPEEFIASFGVKEGEILSLKYPHDAVYGNSEVAGQDHIVIEQFQYRSPQEQFMIGSKKKQAQDYLGGLRRNAVTKDYIGLCRMPIPNNLSFSNGVSWGDGRINAVEAAAFFTGFNTINSTLNEGIGAGLKNIGTDLGAFLSKVSQGDLGGESGALLSAFASQFALGRLGLNVDANQFIQRGLGQSINPNLELLFNGPKLRSFTFSFNFAPNDELDASNMRKIQRFFKQGMAPKRNNKNLIFLGSPNVFRIRYRTKQRDRIMGLPMHKICALTTCEINYAPDNVYQSYDDPKAGSSPVRTIMNLNFTELTPIFENDYRSKLEQQSNESGNGTFFSDEFSNNKGEGAFKSITQEDTGF